MPLLELNPAELGFPDSITGFRDAQVEAVEHVLTSDKRFTGLGAPPGVGKSFVAGALARLLGGRTVILTATLGLQDQYERMGFKGLVDIRGRSNYPCWEGGNCEDGARLNCREKIDCPYMSKFRLQDASEIVVTSYAYWLSVHSKANGIRKPDTLICDEAHLMPELLGRALDYRISEKELRLLGERSVPGESHEEWVGKAATLATNAIALLATTRARMSSLHGPARDRMARDLRQAESLADKTSRLSSLDANWVIDRQDGQDDGRVWNFQCIWPGQFREWLFQRVERVVLMSATLRPKLFGLLGIKRTDVDFKEWGRQFPLTNGPVIWVPTVRVNHRLDNEGRAKWLGRIGEFVEPRAAPLGDRNGLIHTVSYARAKDIAESTLALAHTVILNGAADPDSASAREAFDKFSQSRVGSILCSPSFSTGWDFKGDLARWQVIAKIPTKDMRSKLLQARRAADPTYEDYLAAQDFVQACGRINRDFDDWGETLLVDDTWEWFGRKAGDHIPKWFRVRREAEVPSPMKAVQ